MEIKIIIDDRIINAVKKLMSRRVIAVLGLMSVVIPLAIYADVPHIFEDGNIIYAEDINENFENLDGRIESYESAVHVDGETGNVGIGTTSPQYRLSLGSYADKIGAYIDATHYNSIEFFRGSTGGMYFDQQAGGTAGYHFSYAGNEKVTIDNAGNVGIGTTVPGQKLEVYGSAGSPASSGSTQNGLFRILGSGGDGLDIGVQAVAPYGAWLQSGNKPNLATNYPLLLNPNGGNVGIGTTSPEYALDVVGQVRADNVATSSDIRLKTDIAPLEDMLNGVQCLDAVTYRWADPQKPQELQIGLIAQEVEECFPEVVSTDEQGYKSVAYARLVAPLAGAIKEQQQVITGLEKRDTEQQSAISRQQDEIARLKAQQLKTDARLARLEALFNTARQ